MPFDLKKVLDEHKGQNFSLYSKYVNPQPAVVLGTIEFDRFYVRGDGSYLYDDAGNRYLDFLSGFGVFALGRSHRGIAQALHDALDADLPNGPDGLLPPAGRPGSGTRRPVALGDRAGLLHQFRVRGDRERDQVRPGGHQEDADPLLRPRLPRPHDGRPLPQRGPRVPQRVRPAPPGLRDDPVRRRPRPRAASCGAGTWPRFIIEPIQGKGVNLAPDEFWPEAQSLCRRYKALMVLDEVQAGLGRTGTFFCHEQFGITPDIITVSKALSGGYVPVGAMLCSAEVSDAVFSSMDRAVVHSSTFSTNQLAMVAGLATLQAFDDEDILDRVRRTGKAFTKALQPLVDRYEFLHEVRGLGLMIGLVFGEPTTASLRRRFRLVESLRPALFSQMIVTPLFHRHRILTQVAADNMNVIKLLPPLIAGDDEVEQFTDALDDVLLSAEKGSSLIFEFGKTMAKGTLHRARL